jgi:hypothetical protein
MLAALFFGIAIPLNWRSVRQMREAVEPGKFRIPRQTNMKTVGRWPACIVVGLGGLASSACFAQAASDCSSVADDKSRLKCYDEQANRQNQKAATPAAPAPSAARSPAPAASAAHAPSPQPAPASTKPAAAASEFGLDPDVVRKQREAANPDGPKEPEQLVARVKTVATKAHGELRITLEDGQVWDEIVHTDTLPPEAGETIAIRRGVMGSYLLGRAKGPAFRVKRIQ